VFKKITDLQVFLCPPVVVIRGPGSRGTDQFVGEGAVDLASCQTRIAGCGTRGSHCLTYCGHREHSGKNKNSLHH
jgi:hypothetical protein